MTIGYPRGAGPHRRSFLLIAFGVLGVLVASGALVWFVADQLRMSSELRQATRLAACLREHMMGDLPVNGEALIEKACQLVVEHPHASAQADCIFAHRDALLTEEGADAIGGECEKAASLGLSASGLNASGLSASGLSASGRPN